MNRPRHIRLLAATLLTGACILVAPAPAGAAACTCSAPPPGSPLELAGSHSQDYTYAFIGTVERIGKPVPGGSADDALYPRGRYHPVVVDVEQWLGAGDPPSRVLLVQKTMPPHGQKDAECSVGFAEGRRYLIEAHYNSSDKTYLTNGCTVTQPYGDAAAPREAPDGRIFTPANIVLDIVVGLIAIAVVALALRGPRRREPAPALVAPAEAAAPPPAAASYAGDPGTDAARATTAPQAAPEAPPAAEPPAPQVAAEPVAQPAAHEPKEGILGRVDPENERPPQPPQPPAQPPQPAAQPSPPAEPPRGEPPTQHGVTGS